MAAAAQQVSRADLNTSSNDALTQMLRLTERNSIPRVEIEKFDGDVWSYRSFIRAFDHLICDKVQNEDEKLYYLEQYTTGQPREIVRGCLHMPTKKGYKEARRLFETRYGNQHKIAACSVDRPADSSRRVLAVGGIIVGPRSIFDPVMAGQRSIFREFYDFSTLRVHVSKTVFRSGMKPSPVCSPFNSAPNEVF